jgi:hypothetical protein
MSLEEAIVRNQEWNLRWHEALARFHAGDLAPLDLDAEIRRAFRETARVYACPECSAHVTHPAAKRCPKGHTLPPQFYLPWKER